MRARELVENLAGVGPAGFIVLAGPVVVVACLVVAAAARKHRALAGVASLAALGAHATFAVAACAVYVGTRWRFIDGLLAPSPNASKLIFRYGSALGTEIFAGAASLVLVPLLAVVLAIEWTRRVRVRGGGAALPVSLVTSTASVVWVVALLAVVDGRAFEQIALDGCRGEECYTILVGTSAATDLARSAVALLGAIGVTAVALAARSAPSMSVSARVACALTLASGVLAFFATRAAADDADHLVPWDGLQALVVSMPADRLPAAPERCGPVPDAPILTVHEGNTMVDGSPTSDLEDVLRRRKKTLTIVGGSHFNGELAIAADSDTPARVIVPYVAAARRQGYVDVRALRRLPPRTFDTKTLGRVPRSERYCATVVPEHSPEGTWDDWVR